MWQLKATLASSQSSRMREIFSPDGPAPQHSEQGFPRCVRTAQKKKCLRFLTMPQRRRLSQGFLDNRISTCLLNQETDYHLIQLHLLPPSAHALSVSAETKGFGNEAATCSFFMRKKKSSPCGLYLPGTFR